MLNWSLVILGGGLGAALRFGLTRLSHTLLPTLSFPLATFGANVLGGFFMGLLMGWVWSKGALNAKDIEAIRLFFGVGILGGLRPFLVFHLR
jgi:fluoride exporter